VLGHHLTRVERELDPAAAVRALLAGRLELIRERGGNPFNDYQLPSAIIKFKQGFGRLIRSRTDTGIVVVLDNRIVSKPYGRRFLAGIPKCRVEIVNGDGQIIENGGL